MNLKTPAFFAAMALAAYGAEKLQTPAAEEKPVAAAAAQSAEASREKAARCLALHQMGFDGDSPGSKAVRALNDCNDKEKK